MSWTMERPQRSPFNLEDLTTRDIELAFSLVRRALVDPRIGAHPEDILHSTNVVVVPMCKDDVLDRGLLIREQGLEKRRPRGFALACVDQKAPRTGSDEVCVRTCIEGTY